MTTSKILILKFFNIYLLLNILVSCNSNSNYAKYNQIGSEGNYVNLYNEILKISSLTFGDFEYAFTLNDFTKLKGAKPVFKNILLYAITEDPTYEYYILINPKANENYNGFIEKDTVIEQNHYKIIISKNAPE